MYITKGQGELGSAGVSSTPLYGPSRTSLLPEQLSEAVGDLERCSLQRGSNSCLHSLFSVQVKPPWGPF